MKNLYRVVKQRTWEEAQNSQYIPRCNNDNKSNRIHLNVKEAVESVAEAYFEPEEQPIVLEIDISNFSKHIVSIKPTGKNMWKQPLVNIPNLPINSVVKVHQLSHPLVDGKNLYKLEK